MRRSWSRKWGWRGVQRVAFFVKTKRRTERPFCSGRWNRRRKFTWGWIRIRSRVVGCWGYGGCWRSLPLGLVLRAWASFCEARWARASIHRRWVRLWRIRHRIMCVWWWGTTGRWIDVCLLILHFVHWRVWRARNHLLVWRRCCSVSRWGPLELYSQFRMTPTLIARSRTKGERIWNRAFCRHSLPTYRGSILRTEKSGSAEASFLYVIPCDPWKRQKKWFREWQGFKKQPCQRISLSLQSASHRYNWNFDFDSEGWSMSIDEWSTSQPYMLCV